MPDWAVREHLTTVAVTRLIVTRQLLNPSTLLSCITGVEDS